MKIHVLKLDSHLYGDVAANNKTCEIRQDDRNFSVGDKLILRSWDLVRKSYDDVPDLTRYVTHIVKGGQYGIEKGYVMMSIKE